MARARLGTNLADNYTWKTRNPGVEIFLWLRATSVSCQSEEHVDLLTSTAVRGPSMLVLWGYYPSTAVPLQSTRTLFWICQFYAAGEKIPFLIVSSTTQASNWDESKLSGRNILIRTTMMSLRSKRFPMLIENAMWRNLLLLHWPSYLRERCHYTSFGRMPPL